MTSGAAVLNRSRKKLVALGNKSPCSRSVQASAHGQSPERCDGEQNTAHGRVSS